MSIVSNTEQTPRRIQVLCSLIATHGPMSRVAAQAMMVPAGDGAQFPVLLREAIRLELVKEGEGRIEIASAAARKAARSESEFLTYVDSRLFVEAPSDTDENKDVRYALAWLLSRPVGGALQRSSNFKAIMQEDMEGDDDYGVSNDLRSGMLFYWARFAGYATGFGLSSKGPGLVIPDPTLAIERRLDGVFGKTQECAISEFLDRLSECCPVLEGGRIRSAVDSRMKVKRRENYLSQATSLALMRLERRGRVTFTEKSDAKRVVLLDVLNDDGRRVSHVARGSR